MSKISKKSVQSVDPDRFTPRQGKIVKISIVAALCLAILFLTGYPQYWFAYAKCGGAPVTYDTGWRPILFNSTPAYTLPDGSDSYKPGLEKRYYCTEQETIDATHSRINQFSNTARERRGQY